MIRILLVDDQATVRQGWRMRLALEPDMDVVGEASDGLQALQLAQELLPDVLLVDLEMPGMDGVDAVRRLAEKGLPSVAVIISIYDSRENRRRARQAGAVAFVGKQQPTDVLLAAIRQAAGGAQR
ncbi:MAG TPA: response regulator transcription factor [Candidatus Sulfomarinibacteraceae bacterium]|nr:response regulator transcription factor [Candidatus Sulfomarinibacteraceae bacterium]